MESAASQGPAAHQDEHEGDRARARVGEQMRIPVHTSIRREMGSVDTNSYFERLVSFFSSTLIH